MEFVCGFGSVLIEATSSGLQISLSQDEKLFKGNVQIEEIFEMEEEDRDMYLQSIQKKMDYDESEMKISCKKSIGVKPWMCSLKRVPLTDQEHLADELRRAHERIDELERQLRRAPEKKGNVRFKYLDGKLSYEFETEWNRTEFENCLLDFFKDCVFRTASENIFNRREFWYCVFNSKTFDELQDVILLPWLVAPSNHRQIPSPYIVHKCCKKETYSAFPIYYETMKESWFELKLFWSRSETLNTQQPHPKMSLQETVEDGLASVCEIRFSSSFPQYFFEYSFNPEKDVLR